jgi:hypothetical protein
MFLWPSQACSAQGLKRAGRHQSLRGQFLPRQAVQHTVRYQLAPGSVQGLLAINHGAALLCASVIPLRLVILNGADLPKFQVPVD